MIVAGYPALAGRGLWTSCYRPRSGCPTPDRQSTFRRFIVDSAQRRPELARASLDRLSRRPPVVHFWQSATRRNSDRARSDRARALLIPAALPAQRLKQSAHRLSEPVRRFRQAAVAPADRHRRERRIEPRSTSCHNSSDVQCRSPLRFIQMPVLGEQPVDQPARMPPVQQQARRDIARGRETPETRSTVAVSSSRTAASRRALALFRSRRRSMRRLPPIAAMPAASAAPAPISAPNKVAWATVTA